jgi:hypothetical protein
MAQVGDRLSRRVLLGLCLCLLAGILATGLRPFTSRPHNDVNWIDNQNGLSFGEYGSILSAGSLRFGGPPDGPWSIELWMQPGLIHDANTMLAFDSLENTARFKIKQSLDDVALERTSNSRNSTTAQVVYVPHALRQDTPLFITLTSSGSGMSIYLDGVLVRSSDISVARRDLSGQLVVGNSPFADDSWSGVLRGLGLYNQALTAEDVRLNYAAWKASGRPSGLAEKQAIAIFRFDERTGTVVHNQVLGGIDLYIPDHYLVLHPPFLEAFWRPTNWDWSFWKDVLVNVIGFVPLGFFFCVYFSRSMTVTRAMVLTILFGCAVSFLIEATQYYLPTRDSDSRDWLDNTLGTILGALMCGPGFVQRILAKFGCASIDRSTAGNPLHPAVVRDP